MAIRGRSVPIPAIVSRNSLADDPVLTTPTPVIVDAPVAPRRTSTVLTLRSPSLQDLATPSPLIVSSWPRRTISTAIVLRSSAEDAAAPAGTLSPIPLLVIGRLARWVAPTAIVSRAPALSGPHDPNTHRPFTGTVSRPGSGTTVRPNSGVVIRP